jgi:chromosome segregation ATPase
LIIFLTGKIGVDKSAHTIEHKTTTFSLELDTKGAYAADFDDFMETMIRNRDFSGCGRFLTHLACSKDQVKREKYQMYLYDNLKAAESKAEALNKELIEEKDTTAKIAEMNAKLEAKMKSNKKSDKKEAKEAAEKFQNALNIVQQQLAAEKKITAELKGLQGRLEETEQQLLTTIKSRDFLTEKLEEVIGFNTDLKKDLAESKESQAHLLDRTNKLLERLDDKDNALSKINMEKLALVESLTATQGLNTQLTSEIKVLTTERSKIDAEVNKLLNRLEENQRLLTVATVEKDQLRSMYGEYIYDRAPGSQSWQYCFSSNNVSSLT